MKKQLLNALFCLSLGVANQAAAQVTLVEPAGTQSQDINRVSTVGTKLYFMGREQGGSATDVYLWSNDGINSTKIKLMSSLTSGINASYFFPLNGKALFFYSDGASASGYEPWITDGTAAGTMMIKDINPGSGNSVFSNGLHAAFIYNNKAYFTAYDGVSGDELWVTDGTSAGTMMVKDINVGSNGSSINTSNIVIYKGEMYFAAKSNTWMELWHSDGTPGGTLKVNNPPGLMNYETALIPLDTSLYFGGMISSSNNTYGLFKTNGTTLGTTALTGSLPATPLAAFTSIVSNGTDVFFGFQYTQSFAYQYRLYKTSGGTSYSMVKDSLYCRYTSALGNKIFFSGQVTGSTTSQPWITDGTTPGTYTLNAVSWNPGGLYRNVSPVYNNKIYFGAGNQLWQTDGTVLGTVTTATMGSAGIWDFSIMGSDLYFNGGNPANGNRQELFKIGGTAGISEQNGFAAGIVIYPQPATETVSFNFNSDVKEVEISLFDIAGKELKKEVLEVYYNKTQVNVNDLSEGMYLVRLTSSDGRTATGRIVIAK
jgi:ELWxxDGT repeat protein